MKSHRSLVAATVTHMLSHLLASMHHLTLDPLVDKRDGFLNKTLVQDQPLLQPVLKEE